MKEFQRIEEYEKDELLFENPKNGLDIGILFVAYAIITFSLIILVPKIYLTSNIYYSSRDIAKLQTQKDLLKEENDRLKRELENIKFKYLMMNLD